MKCKFFLFFSMCSLAFFVFIGGGLPVDGVRELPLNSLERSNLRDMSGGKYNLKVLGPQDHLTLSAVVAQLENDRTSVYQKISLIELIYDRGHQRAAQAELDIVGEGRWRNYHDALALINICHETTLHCHSFYDGLDEVQLRRQFEFPEVESEWREGCVERAVGYLGTLDLGRVTEAINSGNLHGLMSVWFALAQRFTISVEEFRSSPGANPARDISESGILLRCVNDRMVESSEFEIKRREYVKFYNLFSDEIFYSYVSIFYRVQE